MNLDLFRNSPSGRLVRSGPSAHGYWTFVPHPLPPPISFDLSLAHKLSAADRALGELSGLGSALSNPHLITRPFIRREAVLSSQIEGTQTEIADLYAYEAGQLPLPGINPPPESDVREVLNYVHALEYGIERLQTLPVSLRLMRELHERLMRGVRGDRLTPGEFRRSQNWIGHPGSTLEDADYVPPSVDDMRTALADLETYLHRDPDYPPLIRLALIHYQFEAIHPFLDGNGRIGRLLVVLLMIHWRLLPLPLLNLSVYLYRNRPRYYELLMKVSTEGAWVEWLVFFLDGVAEQASDGIQRARQLQELQKVWHDRLYAERAGGLLHGIVDLLFEAPILSARQVVERFEVTHKSAIAGLRRLQSLGMVAEVSKRSRKLRYLASDIMRIVD